ncbi:MAG TPA: 50S ribosomal protein L1 [Candidatus Microsaccharimonas sp.]|nr:50S ribosomal protein L1 [Candidatus Microsaccharimonas sp.]
MAKTKAELLEEATALNLEVTGKNTIAEITAAIEAAAPAETNEETSEDTTLAKAGKRSAKGLAEAEEKQAKEERKEHAAEAKAEEAEKPKQLAKPARSRLERQGKKFRDAAKLVEKDKAYTLDEAVELAAKTSPVKFDATIELHVNLGVDPRQADQNIRDNLVLPAGTGKTVKIAVFDDAKVEGVEIAGVEAVTKALEKGEMNFDILIATPAQMPKLGKFARALGPRGLMPNPKSGTVTTDVAKAVAEAKAGRVEYRVDSTGIIHLGVGKASFTKAQLLDNVNAVMANIKSNKPNSVKGNYLKAVHLTSSMGPSITVDLASI